MLCIVQYFVMLTYWPVGAYMASYSNPGLSAQVGSAKHVGPSQHWEALSDPGIFSQRHHSLQSDAGWCNATRPECFLTRHRLVLSLTMMMNGALKGEWLVESWAWLGLIILAMVFSGGVHLSV